MKTKGLICHSYLFLAILHEVAVEASQYQYSMVEHSSLKNSALGDTESLDECRL